VLPYRAKNEIDRAIADYSKAIEIDPLYGNAYFSRGAFEAKGDHVHAIADFTKAIEVAPQNADLFYGRGLAHRAKGERMPIIRVQIIPTASTRRRPLQIVSQNTPCRFAAAGLRPN
jgi:tetratricopeptide (TPR) repeat protein